ncbi:MAG: hypothetical protein IT370_15360 [Deltaproteobacteria bacterium]|nr:hypothetical protein [Deltaproteobacteria bacterium]
MAKARAKAAGPARKPATPARQLEAFIARFEPAVAKVARDAVAKLRKRLPGASVLVYDNYNALAIAFACSEAPGDIVLSIAVYPRHASLFLMAGPALHDPDGLLEGSGTRVRHIKLLEGARVLDRPPVRALLAQALELAKRPMPRGKGAVVIRSVSKRQRPRRLDG